MSKEQKGNLQPELPSRPSRPNSGSRSPGPGHSTISNTDEHEPSIAKIRSSGSKHPIHQFQFQFQKSKGHTVAPADAKFTMLKERVQVKDPTATLPSEKSDSGIAVESLDDRDRTEAACRSTLRHIARSHGLELSIPNIKIAYEPLQSFPFLPVSPLDPDRHRDFDIAHELESNSSEVDRRMSE